MPFSSESGKKHIKRVVQRVPHAKMLDIGCGCGTYAKMFPDAQWTGVEIWKPYVDQYGLNNLYGTLFNEDARHWIPDDHYDIAIAGDVLEHMSEEEAGRLLNKLRGCADTVIVSIPLGHYPQDAYEGNPYERHVKDNWTDEAVRWFFGQPTWARIDNEIGIYVWSKHKIDLKIAVYAISKNEEQFVERFCASAKDADLIVVADTGSTDGTDAKARECGAVVHDICISPWRFDIARNTALSLIPRDIDICISLDLDEVLEPGWREEIERIWAEDTTRLRYMFDWGCGIKFRYEKIHARHGYRWHHPCHEYPVPDPRIKEVWAETDMLLVSHHPDPTKSRGQYMELLEMSVKEDPRCPRNAFYHARELTFHSRWTDAITALKAYLNMPEATWPNERCYAMRLLGKAYAETGQPWEAEKWLHMACGEAPNTREPWCELAMLMYRSARWEECYAFSMRALKITDRALVYTCDPAVWGFWPHDLAAISAWHLGLIKTAIEQGEKAVELAPDDLRLRDNLEWFTGKKAA